jgi:hypothetical protein
MANNPDLMTRFLAYQRAERGASENTTAELQLTLRLGIGSWLSRSI